MDLDIHCKLHDDNYCSVKGAYFTEPEDVESKPLYDVANKKECPHLWKGIIEKSQALFNMYQCDAKVGGTIWGPFTVGGFLKGVEALTMDIMLEPDIAIKASKRGTELVHSIVTRLRTWEGITS